MAKKTLLEYAPELATEWHPTKNGNLCPSDIGRNSDKKAWWKCKEGHEWEATVKNRNALKSGCPTCARQKVLLKSNLAMQNPNIAAEWHPAKNGDLRPSDVGLNSGKKVWWQCSLGHEWQATVAGRARKTTNCPFCANKKVLPGFNDLETKYPDLVKEWHPTKNGSLTPDMLVYGTDKRVWWMDSQGHEWEAPISRRIRGSGCPVCAGKKVVKGVNDFATIHPELMAEWHPTKNEGLSPYEVTAGSAKSVWWQCSHGHEWQTPIVNRHTLGTGCPSCAKQHLLVGIDDLFAYKPEFTAEWLNEKNAGISPNDLLKASDTIVWWRCQSGHEYRASLAHRLMGLGCPFCENRYVKSGVNDLATLRPEIAAQWHPTKNEDLKPELVPIGSGKSVWWKCELGHEWQEQVIGRTHGNNCPYCSGHKVWPGFNDLATVNPELAAQWHPTKNGDLTPKDVSSGSARKVWWLYPYDDPKTGKHFDFEWQAPVYSRNRSSTCPFLINARIWPGYNDGAAPQKSKKKKGIR